MDVFDKLDATDEEPTPPEPEEPVFGAPEPGQKKDYSRVGEKPDVFDTLDATDAEPAPTGNDREAVMARIEAANADRPREDVHPILGEAPTDPHQDEALAFWMNMFEELPAVGGLIEKAGRERATKSRVALTGMPEEGARTLIEAERTATDRANPWNATLGKLVGSIGGLTIAAAQFPKAFGLASKEGYKLPAAVGGTVMAGIKMLDNWIKGKPQDPIEIGLTGITGIGSSVLATSLNRLFVSTLKPGLEGLYKTAIIKHKIPLGAGKISANPVFGKLDGQLLAEGESILPLVARAQKGEARAISAWHRAITRTIGSDAPMLTAKVLRDTTKRITDRVAAIKKALTPNAPDRDALLAELEVLRGQTVNLRLLDHVTSIDKFGRFKPEKFNEVITKAINASGKGGDSEVAELADIGAVFLKETANPKLDLATAVRLIKGSLKQGLFTGAPAAAAHVVMHGLSVPGDLTTAGIITAPIAAAKLGARLLGTQIAGAAARSTGLGNALVTKSLPVPGLIKPAAGIVRGMIPGVTQQAVPAADAMLKRVVTP